MKPIYAAALLALTLALPARGDPVKAGDLTIEGGWARATPKGSAVGAGYLTIKNDGANADRLTGVSADFATVQVHEMKMSSDVMEMREVQGGLEIPAHGAVTLKPNGYHLMFLHLKHPLARGDTARVSLTFEHAGAVAVDLPIAPIGAMGPGAGGASQMKGMKM